MTDVPRSTSAADRLRRRTTYLAIRRKGSVVGCSADTVRMSVTLPRQLFDKLRLEADGAHVSLSNMAAELIADGIIGGEAP